MFIARLLLLSLFLLPAVANSCSCYWTEYFCDYAASYFEWTEGETIVARAKLLEYRVANRSFPLYDFELLEVYGGAAEPGKRVSLLGQDGLNCNGPTMGLSKGNEYVILFPNRPDQYFAAGGTLNGNRYPIYDFPGCGPSALAVEGIRVKGAIAEGVDQVLLRDFQDELGNCIDEEYLPGNPTPNFPTTPEADVWPNPASESFQLSFSEPTIVERVLLYDMRGALLTQDNLNGSSIEQWEIEVSNLPSGVYLLVVETDGLRVKKQVVKL